MTTVKVEFGTDPNFWVPEVVIDYEHLCVWQEYLNMLSRVFSQYYDCTTSKKETFTIVVSLVQKEENLEIDTSEVYGLTNVRQVVLNYAILIWGCVPENSILKETVPQWIIKVRKK